MKAVGDTHLVKKCYTCCWGDSCWLAQDTKVTAIHLHSPIQINSNINVWCGKVIFSYLS